MRTRVGYAGGSTPAPTYAAISDHTEAIEIDFDPELITYAELVELFFNNHNACRPAYSRQYRSLALYADDAQRNAAQEAMQTVAQSCDGPLSTALEPYQGFTLAEDYHQKYLLRRHAQVLGELLALYPASADFLASTAVTRANAFLGGNGTPERLRTDLPRLGLSPEALKALAP